MKKSHFRHRGGVVYLSREAEHYFKCLADLPDDLSGLETEYLRLVSLLREADPQLSARVLVGVTRAIDLTRLIMAATPADCVEALDVKREVFKNSEPLQDGPELLPLLVDASLLSDEYRLGVRPGRRRIVNE